MRLCGIRFDEHHPPPSPEAVTEAFPETPGLYLHVPFCGTLCPFCPYNKVPFEADLSAAYFRRLAGELAAYTDLSPGPFPSLYVGGGTPTLCLDGLIPLVSDLDVRGERAIEVLPTHMTPQGAQRLQDAGFDFVSLGVQSFHAPTLRRLRRPTSPRQNRRAVEVAVDRFTCVDVDLIFDAAYDEPSVLLDDLRTCFRHGVHQVSTYPLMRFGYTPFGRQRHERRKEHALLRRARDLAAEHGYERRSVWTFNRAATPSYTSITRPYFLGLGAGAATYAGVVFAVNHFGLEPYMRSVDEGRLPIARLARLPVPAASAYRAFWQAYTGRLPLHSADRLLSHPMAKALATGARTAGWVARAEGALQLTPSGYDRYHDMERWVTYHLIEPLWAELMREHAAPSEPSWSPSGHDRGSHRSTHRS